MWEHCLCLVRSPRAPYGADAFAEHQLRCSNQKRPGDRRGTTVRRRTQAGPYPWRTAQSGWRFDRHGSRSVQARFRKIKRGVRSCPRDIGFTNPASGFGPGIAQRAMPGPTDGDVPSGTLTTGGRAPRLVERRFCRRTNGADVFAIHLGIGYGATLEDR